MVFIGEPQRTPKMAPGSEKAAAAATPPEQSGSADRATATMQDRHCALFVRAAFFPWKVDWNGKGRHHAIHPALTALDRVRKELVEKKQTPFSTLFPRGVMLVPSPDNPSEIQWNGQPNMKDDDDEASASVEVIPNALTVKCAECRAGVVQEGVKAYFRVKQTGGTAGQAVKREQELVVCSNRVLQRDYHNRFDGKSLQTLLEERKDLPAQSMMAVEEILARELSKLQVADATAGTAASSSVDEPLLLAPLSSSMTCPEYARMEMLAARVAECMYERKGNEVRKGSSLRPAVGFSWLPPSVQTDFQNRCVKEVAAQHTSREFKGDKMTTRACVNDAWKTISATTQ
jgi:hypothetical protein